jgi:drug/metabolite transporter (DMT)-like permease
MLWVPVTLAAAALQTARNATQAGLVESLGTLGATQVRFTFGFPFAVVFLALGAVFAGPVPALTSGAAGWAVLGALAQIAATALMLTAMRQRGFGAATALIKTEPVLIALGAWALLGEGIGPVSGLAIAMATAGVVLMAWRPGARPDLGATAIALAAAALFGLSAIGFRGAITALPEGDFLIRASLILTLGLGMQAALLGLWLLAFDRAVLVGSLRVWRQSLGAGFLGAAASQFWFLGFALTTAAHVRTLALVEVLMARAVGGRLFGEGASRLETTGVVMLVAGVGLLLAGAGAS